MASIEWLLGWTTRKIYDASYISFIFDDSSTFKNTAWKKYLGRNNKNRMNTPWIENWQRFYKVSCFSSDEKKNNWTCTFICLLMTVFGTTSHSLSCRNFAYLMTIHIQYFNTFVVEIVGDEKISRFDVRIQVMFSNYEAF